MKMKKLFVLLTVMLILSACSNSKGELSENTSISTSEIIEQTSNTDTDECSDINEYSDTDECLGMDADENYTVEVPMQEVSTSENLLQDEIPENQAKSPERVLTSELCVGTAKEIFEQTNAERAAVGVEPLLWDDELAKCANIRAEEILTNFSHVRDDGTKCYVLSDLIFGENIARGPHATGAEFLEHWMESEGHKANILHPQYTTMGVGVTCTEQGDTAVQLFGCD